MLKWIFLIVNLRVSGLYDKKFSLRRSYRSNRGRKRSKLKKKVKEEKKKKLFLLFLLDHSTSLLPSSPHCGSMRWMDYRTRGCWNRNRLLVQFKLLINIDKKHISTRSLYPLMRFYTILNLIFCSKCNFCNDFLLSNFNYCRYWSFFYFLRLVKRWFCLIDDIKV